MGLQALQEILYKFLHKDPLSLSWCSTWEKSTNSKMSGYDDQQNRAIEDQKMVEDAEEKGISPSLTSTTINNSMKTSLKEKNIVDSFCMMERHSVDLLVEKTLCANGIPFNVLRSPDFIAMARTTLLDECKRDIEKYLVPLKDTWFTNGVSIISDGWTNIKHKPLINVIASNSHNSIFLYAETFEEKTGKKIASFLLKSIDDIGPSNVLQVITDNAANCKAAGKEIENVHKHIFWSPCVVHTLNLIFKDFAAEFSWIPEICKRAKDLVKFFINHSHALAMFRTNYNLKLIKVAKTRFASHHILLRRVKKCRESFALTVVLMAWKKWVRNSEVGVKNLGEEIAATIGDDQFWEDVDNILSITKPIYLMIKFADADGFMRFADSVPMHCLGFSLNPHFYDANYLRIEAPCGIPRRPPNHDLEVVKGVMTALEKIGEDASERKLLREQLSKFQAKEGIFGSPAARIDAVSLNPISWWSTYGSETPQLAEVAFKILSQPISSSSAERVWSTYSYIHSAKQNRLNAARADKLVFIHFNACLLSRCSESYKKGPSKKWDVNPENSLLEESAVRLEDTNLE
ncbi:uncharacterized protein LOC141695443 [Apium graveolens]|uniref:uncharacterized protein LOC141695443 n=1 Tax=Apium graveolens TaxID=4045 RepID=UPI003D7A39FF